MAVQGTTIKKGFSRSRFLWKRCMAKALKYTKFCHRHKWRR